MLERNRVMVQKSSACVAYCTRESGGTAYTLRYAVEKELHVYNIPVAVRGGSRA